MAKIGINLQSGQVEKDKTKKGELIIGIDLGTTNSLLAYINAEGKAECLKEESAKHSLVPSVIHWQEGQPLVGQSAKEMLIKDPENTIFSVKRLLGKSYGELKDYQGFFSYEIIPNEQEDGLLKVRLGNKFYNPIELSAVILKSLKERAEKLLKQPVQKAVITVPAYFNDSQRQATRDAGKLAGLDVLRIVNEPTAASLAYGIGLDPDEQKTIAVYDLGGGTFDVSILSIDNGIFEVLATHGDTFLGGDDVDRAILKHWAEGANWSEQRLQEDRAFAQELRLLAEEAKKTLSQADEFEGELGGEVLRLNKAELVQLTEELIQRTIKACEQALKDAELNLSDIDEVVLVGGSTRMPIVKEAVAKFFGQAPKDELNPDEVVALGAAIQADVLAGNQKDILLLDVTPLSLGIETVGGLMDVIIPRNSKVPMKAGRQYTTSVDGQVKLKVAVYQGERELVANNRKLGEFVLKGIPPMAAGMPKIEIHFLLNADGILKVRAKELRSGVEQLVEMRSPYGISEEEMGRMLLDSIKNAKEDMAIKALIEARTEAESVLLATDKFIGQNESILSEEEIVGMQNRAASLAQACGGEDKDLIQQRMEELNQYARPMAERAMDQSIVKAVAGKKIEEQKFD